MPHSEQEGASSVVKRVRADAAIALGSEVAAIPGGGASGAVGVDVDPALAFMPSSEASSSTGGFSFKYAGEMNFPPSQRAM